MSSLWSETDLAHRQAVALTHDHLPLQSWNISLRVLNALLTYNHKLTIGDVIRDQTNLGTIRGLGAAGIKELDTKIAILLDNSELPINPGVVDRQRTLILPDVIGQLPLGLLHLDTKTHQALVHNKILTIATLYQVESSLLGGISGLHVGSLSCINTAVVMLVNTIQQDGTVDWITYYSLRDIDILPLSTDSTTSTDMLLIQVPKILEEIFIRDKDTRSWTIIQRRFGLGKEKLILEDIGNAYGITRERVRQIEAKSLEKLQTVFWEQNYSGKNYHIHPILHALLQSIHDMVEAKQYKFITEVKMLEYIQHTFAIDLEKQAPFLFFLLLLLKMEKLELSYPRSDAIWGYNNAALYKQIDNVLKRLDKFLTEETSLPHIEFDILVHINKGIKKSEQVKMEQLSALIELCISIESREDGSIWGKFTYLKGRTNQVERLLGENGRPMSVPNLAREINHRLSFQKSYHPISNGSLLNQMCGDKRFVAIGRSGKWGLASWENIDTKSILNYMKEYLINKNRAVNIDELYDYVSERRPVSKQSIKTYLVMEQTIFTRMGRTTWGLANWDHDNKNDTWSKEFVAEFVADFFKKHKARELEYQSLKQALMNAANINSHQAMGLLNHCPALKTQRIGYTGDRKAIFQANYKETLARAKNHNVQRGKVRQQLEESALHILEVAPNRQIAQAELIRQLVRLHNCPESTVYAAISQMQFIERTSENKHANICRLRETQDMFESGILMQRISKYVKKLLSMTSSKEMPLMDLVLRIQKEFSCPRVTAYSYVSRLDFIERREIPHVRGKLCCLKEALPIQPPQMFPQIQEIKNSALKADIERTLPLLNEDFVDLGLFSLGKLFETTMKRYLVAAHVQGKIPVIPPGKSPDKLSLADMISCIKNNGIVTNDAELSYLRQSRNDRAHGITPTEDERKLLLKNVQFWASLYLDYIKFFDDLYQNL